MPELPPPLGALVLAQCLAAEKVDPAMTSSLYRAPLDPVFDQGRDRPGAA